MDILRAAEWEPPVEQLYELAARTGKYLLDYRKTWIGEVDPDEDALY